MDFNIENITNEFENIVKSNILYRFNNEYKNTFDDEKKSIINKIIKEHENIKTIKSENSVEKNKLNDFLDKMTQNTYKKPWGRLNYEQKLTKIDEFLKDKKLNKKEIIKYFKSQLDTNKLSKLISYDQINCKIIGITNLDNIIKDIQKNI